MNPLILLKCKNLPSNCIEKYKEHKNYPRRLVPHKRAPIEDTELEELKDLQYACFPVSIKQ